MNPSAMQKEGIYLFELPRGLDAAGHGELVFNCLRGDVSIDVLTAVSGELEG